MLRAALILCTSVVAGLAAAIFVALQLFGITNKIPARACLISAWVFAVATVGLHDSVATNSWTHILIAVGGTAIVSGLALFAVDRWASKRAHEQTSKHRESKSIEQTMIDSPNSIQAGRDVKR